MLTVEGLTTDYGPVRAVDGVSLEVPDGSVTAVLGANGAGKTSLLRTITGLVQAPRGHASSSTARTSPASPSRRSSAAAWPTSPRAGG